MDENNKIIGVDQIQELLKISTEVYFKSGDTIFSENQIDENFYIILSGEIEIFKSTSDNELKSISHLKSGEVLGEGVLHGLIKKPTTAKAILDSTLLSIKKDDFLDLFITKPQVGVNFLLSILNFVNERLNETNNRLLTLYEINEIIENDNNDILILSKEIIKKLIVITKSRNGAIFIKDEYSKSYRKLFSSTESIDDLIFDGFDKTKSSIVKIDDSQFIIVDLKGLGYLALSRLNSDTPYNEDQLKHIVFIADQISNAIRTCLRYSENRAKEILSQKKFVL